MYVEAATTPKPHFSIHPAECHRGKRTSQCRINSQRNRSRCTAVCKRSLQDRLLGSTTVASLTLLKLPYNCLERSASTPVGTDTSAQQPLLHFPIWCALSKSPAGSQTASACGRVSPSAAAQCASSMHPCPAHADALDPCTPYCSEQQPT